MSLFGIGDLICRLVAPQPGHRLNNVEFPKSIQPSDGAKCRQNGNGLIVGFYTTNSIYEREANRMKASAARLGLSVALTPVPSVGTWVRNASMKAEFLSNARRSRRGPLLYVDVDAVFHGDPWPLLDGMKGDIGVCRDPLTGELLAGTILINDTAAAQDLLDVWKGRCNRDPDVWDQVALAEILGEISSSAPAWLEVGALPISLCWIFDRPSNEQVQAVYIEQLQASRETTIRRRRFGRIAKRLKRRRQRVEEIDRILFSAGGSPGRDDA